MIDIDEHQTATKIPLFNLGFRAFFLGSAVFSVFATLVWLSIFVLDWQIQLNTSPLTWHAHEMIYGYSLAVIAGFLLTAIKNWTHRQTLNGFPLFILFFIWMLARALPFFGNSIPLEFTAIINGLFIVSLLFTTAIPIFKARQWQHLGIIAIIALLLPSNIFYYLGLLGHLNNGVNWGLYSGLYLILAMVLTMARRVIPFFIEKGVGYTVQVKNWAWLDISCLVFFLLFCIVDTFASNQLWNALLASILFVLHGIRMAGWYTGGIWKKPLLWVLYLAYGALVAGFALNIGVFTFDLSPSLAVHAFSFGGIGLMTIGMMSRVTLGHTGRNVFEPPPALFWVFALLLIGTLIRVLMPIVAHGYYTIWIGVSQILWVASFTLFIIIFSPMLMQSRVDGRDG
ncbi:MAG: NnrS family protein [Gammaproteobacteria bacterium]|nr:NnrS family protein [Gammaproteobacteria bacterium]